MKAQILFNESKRSEFVAVAIEQSDVKWAGSFRINTATLGRTKSPLPALRFLALVVQPSRDRQHVRVVIGQPEPPRDLAGPRFRSSLMLFKELKDSHRSRILHDRIVTPIEDK